MNFLLKFPLVSASLSLLIVTVTAEDTVVQVDVADRRPNILLIMTDQQSADAMSCRMGDQYLYTPAMDSLAESGMVFTRAYVTNPLCMPARNSIFTGKYPHQTGVTQNSIKAFDASQHRSLGSYFRRAGYQTAYFGKWHLGYSVKESDQHGFDVRGDTKRVRYWDTQISSSVIEYLSRPPDQPFLAVASFHNPHDACELARGQVLPGGPIGDPPPPQQCPPAAANLSPPAGETDSIAMLRRGYHASGMFPVADYSVDQWRQHRWGYYRLIEKVDREIGLVLGALRKRGLAERTVVVFSSDHGECSGAHGFNQKTVFYDESARVPMIVSYPGQTKVGVSDRLVNTGIDLLPTLLQFANIPLTDGEAAQLPGRSLHDLATGQASAQWRDHLVIQNDMAQAAEVDGRIPRMQGRMVRSDRFKYCIYEYGVRRESLIDMQADPNEMQNLAADPKFHSVLLAHRQLLRSYARAVDDSVVSRLLADQVGPRPFPD